MATRWRERTSKTIWTALTWFQRRWLSVLLFLVQWVAAVAVAAALYDRWFGKKEVSDSDAISRLLLFSVVLAVSEITSRFVMLPTLQRDVTSIRERMPGNSLSAGLLREDDLTPFSTHLDGARAVDMIGASFNSVLPKNEDLLLRAVRDGVVFRFLLVRPGSSASAAAAEGLFGVETQQDLDRDIEYSVRLIDKLKAKAAPDQITLRFVDFVPFGSVTHFRRRWTGVTVGSIYPFEVTNQARPYFTLFPGDHRWYDFFLDQFEAAWAASDPNHPRSVGRRTAGS